jgi:hypothetical protein
MFRHRIFTRIFEGDTEKMCIEDAARLLINKKCIAVYLKLDKIFLKVTVTFAYENNKFNVFIYEISDVLRFQRNIYLSSIETNFSHEQMTPLNIILAHSDLLMQMINSAEKNLAQMFNMSKEIH